MNLQLFFLPGNEIFAKKLLSYPQFEAGEVVFRRFPDQESYVRLLSDVRGRRVVLLCTLHEPDEKLMMLYVFARLAKQMGAESVVLAAPYLAYMRQDKAFHPGEAVTASMFGELLSDWVDGLITVDPHLHRYRHLSDIYHIPTRLVHAESLIVRHIQQHIAKPVLIGPDAESKQWVATVARKAGSPFSILKKERLGDRKVRIHFPAASQFREHTPVLVDDIISTGHTMMETTRHLNEQGLQTPVCIGVHAVFAGNAWQEMKQAGIQKIITTNTIPHPTNELDMSDILAEGIIQLSDQSLNQK
jgi:ribose-phosphate pyrophosphokinase